MLDNDAPKYSKWQVEYLQELDQEKLLTNTYLEELNNNEAFNQYLNQFRGDTAIRFKEDFARFKAQFDVQAKDTFKRKEAIDLHFVDIAREVFWYIQQKKLFDTQCLWRADRIILPEITISHDFRYWSANIKNCTFIEPVTEDEIQLLQQYLASYSYSEDIFTHHDWQDYPTYKREHVGDPSSLSMPEWYHFYNMHRGTESLMLLPDVVSDIENTYIHNGIQIGVNENNPLEVWQEDEPKPTDTVTHPENVDDDDPPPYVVPKLTAPRDTRPYLDRSYKTFGVFLSLFKDDVQQEIYDLRVTTNSHTKIDRNDMIVFEEALDTLKYAGKNYPMQPYHCWHKGTIKLAMKFKADKIIEALPMVFEEYEMRLSMGIAPYLNKREIERIQSAKRHADSFKRWYHIGKSNQ